MKITLFDVNKDRKFCEHFKRLQQVFLCITNDCNLRCKHCLYKPWLSAGNDMPMSVACSLLKTFYEMGAKKLSILGGEPTVYGRRNRVNCLYTVISYARSLGYQYIRLVTNGQFDKLFEPKEYSLLLNEVSFSFDGTIPETHEKMRGAGTFARSLTNMCKVLDAELPVDITFTVNRNMSMEIRHFIK